MRRYYAFVAVFVFIVCGVATAATIHVPADQPTIQTGINAAVDGDTVLVAPGEYSESLLIDSKGLVLLSERGASFTVLNPAVSGMNLLEYIRNSQKTNTVSGFEFRNVVDFACIFSDTGNLFILDNVFAGNVVSSGHRAPLQMINGNYTVRGNVFLGNRVADQGGGLSLQVADSAVIERNVFWGNLAKHGGGVSLGGEGAVVRYNLFVGNFAQLMGGGLYLHGASRTLICNNTFDSCGSSGNMGGAISWYMCEGDTAYNNIITNSKGYGIFQSNSEACLLAYNDCFMTNPGCYYGIIPGSGSIASDPRYSGVDHYGHGLRSDSPCIDAGNPSPRYNDPDSTRNDMGAFYFDQSQPWAVNIGVTGQALDHVVAHFPELCWSYYDINPTTQTEYHIEVGSDSNWSVAEMWNSGEVVSSDTSALYAGDPLVDGLRYYGRIRLNNGTKWGAWRGFTFRMNTAPTTPLLLIPTEGGVVQSQQPSLIVRNSTDAEGDSLAYAFQLSPDNFTSSFFFYIKKQDADTITTVVVDSILPENSQYWWRVRASDYYELSPWSPIQSFWVNSVNTAPSAFALVSPSNTLDTAVAVLLPTFAWTGSSDPDPLDSVQYALYIAIDPAFNFAKVITGLPGPLCVLADSLSWGTRYWWKVKAYDLNGGVTWSNQVFTFRTVTLGDADNDAMVSLTDVVFLVNYIFVDGPPPEPLFAGDANCDGRLNISDAVYLVNYIFGDGEPPCDQF